MTGPTERSFARRAALGTAAVLGLVLAIAGIALVAPRTVAGWLADDTWRRTVAGLGPVATGLGALSAASGCGAAWAAWRGRLRAATASIALALALLAAAWGFCVAPALDDVRGDRRLVTLLRAHVAEGRRLHVVGRYIDRESTPGFFGFYFDRRLEGVAEDPAEIAALATREPVVFVMRDKARRKNPAAIPAGWDVWCSGPLGFHDLWVIAPPRPRPAPADR